MRIVKPRGMIIITCAGIVRGEHGTIRCIPKYSLSSELSWGNYYKNLCQKDFESTGLLSIFEDYRFLENIFSRDLYFVGFKKGYSSAYMNSKKLNLIKLDINKIKKLVDGKIQHDFEADCCGE